MGTDVHRKKVTVVGLGTTGLALARLLKQLNARPFVTEAKPSEDVAFAAGELAAAGIPFECGGHTSKAFEDTALVIPSPGVPPTLPIIQEAVAQGAALRSELQFASGHCTSKIIAVTGTNGKTTTTELIYSMLRASGQSAVLCGNNALPLSAVVMERKQPDYAVVEVSSYQLELIDTFRPWIGVILNVRHDHLDRHDSIEDYAATKARLFANQRPGDQAVFNYDDPRCVRAVEDGEQGPWPTSMTERLAYGIWLDGDTIRHGDDAIASLQDVNLLGRHNIENVLAALAALRAGNFPWEGVMEGLRNFHGVEHRIEFVKDIDGVHFYNDSKATNLDATRVALESFDEKVALIMGGRGKGEDYATLGDAIEAHSRAIILIGEEARAIQKALRNRVEIVIRAKNMHDAVLRATGAVKPTGIVLLSPGCASFDMYTGFEERGREFKACVNELSRIRKLGTEAMDRR